MGKEISAWMCKVFAHTFVKTQLNICLALIISKILKFENIGKVKRFL